jgi:hydrogenase nickel incorporation protein HypA/HybF
MHEYSITCSIIEILNEQIKKHNIKKIKKISFELGPFAHIEPQSIEFYYDYLARDNHVLHKAILDFKRKKIEIKCMDCEKTFLSEKILHECKYCSGSRVKILECDDIKIISIET